MCCERSSWHSTTMPVGKWVMRIAESVLFRQDGNGRGRGMNPALRFGFRHALHPVRAGFELKPRVGSAANHADNNFFVAAVLAEVFANKLDLPAAGFGIAGVHAV